MERIGAAGALSLEAIGGALAISGFLADRLHDSALCAGFGALRLFWNLALPYQLGALTRNDPTGRRVVLFTASQAAGMALGPAVVALWVDSVGLIAIHGVAVVAGGFSLLLFLVLHRQIRDR